MRSLVGRTKRAPSQSQRVAEELPRLFLLAAISERASEVARRDQRRLVFCAKQARNLGKNLALDLRGLGVLALL